MRGKRSVVWVLIAGLLVGLFAADGLADSPDTQEGPRANWAEEAYLRSLDPALGLPAVRHPEDNPPTPLKIALGRKLFFDRRLSINGTMSCGMCHIPEQGFTNQELKTAVGVEGRSVKRNSPTILNVAFYQLLFVDGRDPALETQYVAPLTARNEMANPSAGFVVALLKQLSDYAGLFEEAFGGPASLDRIGMALAAYQRTLVAGDSPFDRWRYGQEDGALNDTEIRGFRLFVGKAGCESCHLIGEQDAFFTDQQFHDIGYGWWREQLRQNPPDVASVEVAPGVVYPMPRTAIAAVGEAPEPDLGRYEVTEDPADRWTFRTPSLRTVAITLPYMHDGGFATLAEVLNFYNGGGRPHEGQDPRIRPLGLNQQELADLEAFLRSLTSPHVPVLIREARSSAPDNQ